MSEQRFETRKAQTQFWAEIGIVDGEGIGYMDTVEKSTPFPSLREAENWLTEQGWVYDTHALRRVKEGERYGLTRIRKVEEFRVEKWV